MSTILSRIEKAVTASQNDIVRKPGEISPIFSWPDSKFARYIVRVETDGDLDSLARLATALDLSSMVPQSRIQDIKTKAAAKKTAKSEKQANKKEDHCRFGV